MDLANAEQELRDREPIFHQESLCSRKEDLEKYTHSDFWEVGASGKVYSRDFVIDTVEKRFREGSEEDTSKWVVSDFVCRQLGESIYMVTYQLNQNGRLSRRMTLWKYEGNVWKVFYHQGTLISE